MLLHYAGFFALHFYGFHIDSTKTKEFMNITFICNLTLYQKFDSNVISEIF